MVDTTQHVTLGIRNHPPASSLVVILNPMSQERQRTSFQVWAAVILPLTRTFEVIQRRAWRSKTFYLDVLQLPVEGIPGHLTASVYRRSTSNTTFGHVNRVILHPRLFIEVNLQ
jgi:hypothetical protein